MTSNRIVPLLAVILIVVGILFAVFRSVSSPTPEECKQMDVLSGQPFVFDGVNPSNWGVGT